MCYLIVNDGTIENMIVADEAFAAEIGAFPAYEGAEIGQRYAPPLAIGVRVKNLETGMAGIWTALDAAYQEGVSTAYDS